MKKIRIKLNKNESIISCILLVFIIFIIMLDDNDVIYYYSKINHGVQFDAPLLDVQLSDGYYFVIKNNAKSQYVISHRNDDIQYIVDADRKVDLKLWEEEGAIKYLDGNNKCKYYKIEQSNNNFMVTVREKIFITYTLLDNSVVNWNNVCEITYFNN